ncbi:hypothetical protein KHQ89_06595 [Mycoplasmatota bacterium]|nr:hypothetical protein KHQ89_06595 [Mycoplasmatota bacterium]
MKKKFNYLLFFQILILLVFLYSLFVLFLSDTPNGSTDSTALILLQIDIFKAGVLSVVSILIIIFIELIKNKQSKS